MDVSKFLSKVFGLYEIIISIAMMMNMNHFITDIEAMMNNGPLMLYIGCITVIMGLLLVVSHNIWMWEWRVLVTIVSWIVLLKGVSILLFPHALDPVTIQFLENNPFAWSVAGFDLLLGLLFCYFGFRRKA